MDWDGAIYDDDVEEALREALASVDRDLAGRLRWMVAHGYEIVQIKGRRIELRLRVIWEPMRGVIRAQASDQPSIVNLREFRFLLERALASSGWLSRGEGVEWTATMDEGARPGNLDWRLVARFG